eukprot:CAMPEP_0202483408 /NCGR_PEP_ID=MMETSP1361-20130828/2655_1 /ASSEMBLY_ACC=CAM_ASM_000849 /TAXON_ID=210615 /ORGANISM="Staurosira complex sp., Strain CCMP2646" /LENGTH=400 /DNA_ID=CAMNT_0049111649 /DNA_START=229 /DNA_END=1428 /DNA_ORIENTATION=+
MKNQKSKKRKQSGGEPDFLGMALSASRKRKPNEDGVPTLFKEDVGDAGLKTKRDSTREGSNFDIRLTKEEKRRRKERQMRFTSCDADTNDDTLDALSAPLKSSRKGSKHAKTKKSSTSLSIVGTCQNLEKPYLRLTTFPNPAQVRPLEVLIRALKHIKCRYIQSEDFEWSNEQLKSVRQDITVQGIKNNFVLDVYETHARILLENGDLNEYNQCQTMIRTLTTGFNGGTMDEDSANNNKFAPQHDRDDATILLKQCDISADEFGGYRLLYALVQNSKTDLTRELVHARSMIRRQGDNDSSNKSCSCRHAVLVVKAVTDHDYHSFFRLYKSAPYLSAYLMDFLVKRVRACAFERIIAAYRPTISIEHFRETLLFKDLEETREFLQHSGAVFVEEPREASFW